MDLLELSAATIDEECAVGPTNRISNELTEVADRVAVVESFSHVWLVRTGEGLVVVDASSGLTAPAVIAAVRRWCSDPVHTLVYTHGHVDHVGGAAAFLADAAERGHPRPRVVGHEHVARRLDRYRRTNGYNQAINSRQFAPSRRIGVGLTVPERPFVPDGTPDPDVTVRDELGLTVGDDHFVLRHARGETDDHLWTEWVGHDACFVGDFLIWNFPNCGNPQKVLRYPAEWAAALRAMSARRPQLVAPAHGLPVVGSARVDRVLDTTAAALEHLVGAVIDVLNADGTLDEALHGVRVPEELMALPWMRPLYDEPEFVVHNIWRTYGGWWGGNPAKLLPAPEARVAAEIAELAGGAGVLADRAAALLEQGDLRTAAELVELAAVAAPGDVGVHAIRATVYSARRRDATSLMAKGIFQAAAARSAEIAGVLPEPHERAAVLGGSSTAG